MRYKNSLILNDTSYEMHAGCVLVMHEINKIAKSVSDRQTSLSIKDIKRGFDPVHYSSFDLILVNGEGSFHHDSKAGMMWLQFLKELKYVNHKSRIVLMNSSWYCNDELNEILSFFDLAVFRDCLSLYEARSHLNCNSLICPDLALVGAMRILGDQSVPDLDAREDGEFFQPGVVLDESLSTSGKIGLSIFIGKDKIKSFIEQLSKGDLINPKKLFQKALEHFFYIRHRSVEEYVDFVSRISTLHTSRFHGFIIAVAANVNCYWYKTNTKKMHASHQLLSALAGLEVQSGAWRKLSQSEYSKFQINVHNLYNRMLNEI